MRFNGSHRFGGPVWGIVSGVHSLIVYGLLTAVIGAAVLSVIVLVLALILDGKAKVPEPAEHTPLPPAIQTPEKLGKQKRQYEATRREAEKLIAEEKKRIEVKQLLEEQRKIDAIKARRERSAEDVARSGLDDFL